MNEFVTLDEIRAAKERIAGVAVRTPLYRVERARLRMGKFPEPDFDLYIKAESEQPIGSFKLRGAYNMVSQLSPEALRARSDYVLERQPCAGCGLCGAGAGGEGRYRDAEQRSRGKEGGDASAGRGDC